VTRHASAPPAIPHWVATLPERLAESLAASWRRGERVSAEQFLEQHPELLDDPEGTVRLIYEEVCLRQEFGEEVVVEEVLRRFPLWARELAVLLDCDRLLRSQLARPLFPTVGEDLGDFRLLSELGRGAQGRVFLARQSGLADRPVVLKVTPCRAREHLSLARLQHTHIIPLYAVHDFPDRKLRALCMPYLGGATLAQILDVFHDQPLIDRTGQSLLGALDRVQRESPLSLPCRGPFRPFFARASYPEAICWIGACLADALHHAHLRGLAHLDLKPSNVLLAADGQPLLLDFHLARESLVPGRPAPDWFGGTPEFMSPEQAAACDAARQGRPVPEPVDGRSDIYSLGRLLYAALAGETPTGQGSLPRLNRCNPQVSPGLADLIHRCLAPAPCDRYASAAALGADLARHLANLPLRGVPNRSFRERWRKWRRRRPYAPHLLIVVLAFLITGGSLLMGILERYREAATALREGQDQLRMHSYAEAARTLTRGQGCLDNLPFRSDLRQALGDQLQRARRAEAAERLHTVAEQIRFAVGTDCLTAREISILSVYCKAAWEARQSVLDAAPPLPPELARQARTDLLDLALLWGDLHRRRTSPEADITARREALRVLNEAESLLGPSVLLSRERSYTLVPGKQVDTSKAIGNNKPPLAPGGGEKNNYRSPKPLLEPRTPWERVALGRALLRTGELERAATELKQAIDLQPQDFWANFQAGVCAYRRKRFADAVHQFGVAVALAPEQPECYYNRALARAALGETAEAMRDYDRALQIAPGLAAAALNRGLLHYREQHLPEARADLERALAHGANPGVVHYNLALVHLARDDQEAALASLEQSLQHDPTNATARPLRERLRAGN
jgi:eukaryotic-like serine/threonine-protein kinase